MAHIFAPKPWHRSKMLNSPGFAPTQSHFKIRSNVRHSSSCFGFHHHNYFPKKMCRKIGHIFSKFYSKEGMVSHHRKKAHCQAIYAPALSQSLSKKMCRKIGHIFSKFYSNVSPHLPKGGVNNEFTNIPTARLAISR